MSACVVARLSFLIPEGDRRRVSRCSRRGSRILALLAALRARYLHHRPKPRFGHAQHPGKVGEGGKVVTEVYVMYVCIYVSMYDVGM